MGYCRKCGAKLEEGAAFCSHCGAPVEEVTDEPENKSVPETLQPVKEEPVQEEKKPKRKGAVVLKAIFGAFGVLLILFVILAVVASLRGSTQDQKVVYEGIEFHVPVKWKLSEDASSDAGLYFYAGQSSREEMLYIASVPDVSYILNLFGADYIMDWLTDYIHEVTGGESIDAQKLETAGYDTYLFDVTGASTDTAGDTVQGGYRIACIINTDRSEMIILYAAGLSAGEDDSAVLSDIDYILANASATSEANSY